MKVSASSERIHGRRKTLAKVGERVLKSTWCQSFPALDCDSWEAHEGEFFRVRDAAKALTGMSSQSTSDAYENRAT